MKRLGGRRMRWVGGILALAMTLVSVFANSVQTDHDKKRVAQMTEKMKTVCVGRFLIDLPVDAEVTIRGGFVGGFDISTTLESTEQFQARMHSMEAEIGAAKNEKGRPSLEWNRDLALESASGKVMVFNRERARMQIQGRMVDSEDFSVRGLLRFPNFSVVAEAQRQAFHRGDELVRLFERLRPLDDGDIPHERGFCMGSTIVRDPYENSDTEAVVMFAGLPGHPDVNIVLSSMAGTDPAPGLLERNAKAAESEPFFMRLAFTTLIEGQRNLNGLRGEELGLRIREANFTTGYSFQWQMTGQQQDIYAPLLTLELESGTNPASGGKPVQSTLSEEAMLELWERVTSSIRLRPTEGVQVAVKEQVTATLGTSAIAGDVCPQTGWWLCGDGGDGIGVLGGQRQFLKEGQRMPQALLLPEQTLWQRLRGVQPSFESHSPTFWKLVDKRSSSRLPASPMLATALDAVEGPNVPAGTVPYGLSQAPIGSIAKTGAMCPASGWWRCEESHALDGTRWFAQGSLLPPATFTVAPSVFANSSNAPQAIQRRSAWRLVRLADASDHQGKNVSNTS